MASCRDNVASVSAGVVGVLSLSLFAMVVVVAAVVSTPAVVGAQQSDPSSGRQISERYSCPFELHPPLPSPAGLKIFLVKIDVRHIMSSAFCIDGKADLR